MPRFLSLWMEISHMMKPAVNATPGQRTGDLPRLVFDDLMVWVTTVVMNRTARAMGAPALGL